MSLILPSNYPFLERLLNINIYDDNKDVQDVLKVLNIGVLNIMPNAEKYEVNVLNSVGQFSDVCIKPWWIRLNDHKYGSSDKLHLAEFYKDFKSTLSGTKLDGVIVTGAPVEHLPYSEINYWEELRNIMQTFWEMKIPQVGLCWAGLAIAELLGIEKEVFDYKLFGVFESKYLSKENDLGNENSFFCPQSRHAGIADIEMEKAAKNGAVKLLAHSNDAGYFVFESTDGLLLAHCGHSEYHKQRIADEYKRDKLRGRDDVKPPANFNVEQPENIWKTHRRQFFKYWLDKIIKQS